jgi:chromosome segregation ATPase
MELEDKKLIDAVRRELSTITARAGEQFAAALEEPCSVVLSRMQRSAGEAQNLESAARAALAELDRQHADLRARIEVLRGEARGAEDRRDALRREVDELEPQVRELQAKYDQLKQHVLAR